MILPYVSTALLVLATVYSLFVSFRQPEAARRSWIFPQTAGRSARIVVGVLTLALVSGVALWLGLSARNSTHATHRTARFLIPEGYTGWIRVEFEVQGAPPLLMEENHYVFKIPPDGALRTSSPEQYGWARDQYYYYSAQGMRPLTDSEATGLIWGKINGEQSGASGKRKYEEFFVGSVEQFKSQANGATNGGR